MKNRSWTDEAIGTSFWDRWRHEEILGLRFMECDLCLLTWFSSQAGLIFGSTFAKKRGTLWWFGVAMIMIVTTQDGWQPCVVLYRTGICHHHGVILHHLKLTEKKYPNGCGGKEIQIWCWGFTIAPPNPQRILGGGRSLCRQGRVLDVVLHNGPFNRMQRLVEVILVGCCG